MNKINRIQRGHIIKFKIFAIEPSPKDLHLVLPRSPSLQKLGDSIEEALSPGCSPGHHETNTEHAKQINASITGQFDL